MVKFPFAGVEIDALLYRFDAVLASDVKDIPEPSNGRADDNLHETLTLALGLLQRLGRLGGGNVAGQQRQPDP